MFAHRPKRSITSRSPKRIAGMIFMVIPLLITGCVQTRPLGFRSFVCGASTKRPRSR